MGYCLFYVKIFTRTCVESLVYLFARLNSQQKSWSHLQKMLPCKHFWDLGLGTPCEVVSSNFHVLNGWDAPQVNWYLGLGTPCETFEVTNSRVNNRCLFYIGNHFTLSLFCITINKCCLTKTILNYHHMHALIYPLWCQMHVHIMSKVFKYKITYIMVLRLH